MTIVCDVVVVGAGSMGLLEAEVARVLGAAQVVVVEPNVVFGPGVSVGDNVTIRAFSHLEGAKLAENVVIGPYARLRPGAVLEKDARVGNFVEIKNAILDEGAKVEWFYLLSWGHLHEAVAIVSRLLSIP